jgi:hypothetical protein
MISGSVVMMFAATKTDPCAEKYKSCTDSCAITESQSQRRGVDRLQVENAYKRCVSACDKAKAACDPNAKKP